MKQVGKRVESQVQIQASGESLAAAFAVTHTASSLCQGRVMFPKGVFRYKTHEEANAHEAQCLAEGMARLARERNV